MYELCTISDASDIIFLYEYDCKCDSDWLIPKFYETMYLQQLILSKYLYFT